MGRPMATYQRLRGPFYESPQPGSCDTSQYTTWVVPVLLLISIVIVVLLLWVLGTRHKSAPSNSGEQYTYTETDKEGSAELPDQTLVTGDRPVAQIGVPSIPAE